MLKPIKRDMNRSRDVAGPVLKRPYDMEMTMAGKDFGSESGLEDYADTGVLEKMPLSSLHMGDQEVPLKALGMQDVVVVAPMGRDSAMGHYKPTNAKGDLKDQSHYGSDDLGSEESKSKGKKN